MGKYLDLEDVTAGNPVAERELAQLREQYESLRETRQMEIRATEEWKDRAQRAEALLHGVRVGVFDYDEIEQHIGGFLDATPLSSYVPSGTCKKCGRRVSLTNEGGK